MALDDDDLIETVLGSDFQFLHILHAVHLHTIRPQTNCRGLLLTGWNLALALVRSRFLLNTLDA
jgi:hypothetical protein